MRPDPSRGVALNNFISHNLGSSYDMTILIAYDGRKNSERALDYAIQHSINYSEPLYILTVVREDQRDPDDPYTSIQEFMSAAQRKAASQGAEVQTIIEVGKPEDAVPEVASRFKCDTIVIGRSDKSALDRLLLGSVTKAVINSDLNVILVSDSQQD